MCGAALCALSCLHGGRGASPATAEGVSESATRVERRAVDRHPPINLLFRLGDPAPAIAFAIAHDDGSQASVELAALLAFRLRAAGLGVVLSAPSQLGVEVAILAVAPGDARAFVRAITGALATPIGEGDACLAHVSSELDSLRHRPFGGSAEQAIASCSGELGSAAAAHVLAPDTLRAELERVRIASFSAQRGAFAAVGPAPFLELAAGELGAAPDWPEGQPPTDPWPANDSVGTDFVQGPPRVSVALRVPDAARAVIAARELGVKGGALEARLQAFLPGFRVERAIATARPRGACLRVDLDPAHADVDLDADEIAVASDLVSDEASSALRRTTDAGNALDESAGRPSDPRDAAAAAAWRALVGRFEPGAPRRLVAGSTPRREQTKGPDLSGAIDRLERRRSSAAIELTSRLESGQGELWLLLANRCGTSNETRDDAGHTALAVALAARSQPSGVALEPWLTSDGLGVLAHAAGEAGETSEAYAERVARALALLLSGGARSTEQPLYARNELAAIGLNRPRPGYARLLDALAPEHPAWLEPRGTFETLSDAGASSLASHAHELLQGPLRLAVLANRDDRQAAIAQHVLERWLLPTRLEVHGCNVAPSQPPHASELSVETDDDSSTESAYLGVSLDPRMSHSRAARATVAELSEHGALFDRAFAEAGLSASASAELLGGSRASALVVTIRANDDETRKAVAAVRQVLEHLARGASTTDDVKRADNQQRTYALAGALSPRRRIVDLWRGTTDDPALTLTALRTFQASLGSASQSVVYVSHRR
jgi:hypothetical protein